MSYAKRKIDNMEQVKLLLLETETGLTPTELAAAIGVDRTSVHRYLKELSVKSIGGVYWYKPTDEEIHIATLILNRSK